MAKRRSLPFRITLLLTLVLIITVLSAIRLFTALGWKSTLDVYMGPLLVAYIAITGAFWTLAGCFVLWAFWRGGRHVPKVFLAASILYAAWGWADRLVVQTTTRPSWPFAVVVTVLLLAFVAFVVLDPRNQSFFGKETYERKLKEPSST